MPADTQRAPSPTSETGAPVLGPGDRVVAAGEPGCRCDDCQDVDRGEMWTRWG